MSRPAFVSAVSRRINAHPADIADVLAEREALQVVEDHILCSLSFPAVKT